MEFNRPQWAEKIQDIVAWKQDARAFVRAATHKWKAARHRRTCQACGRAPASSSHLLRPSLLVLPSGFVGSPSALLCQCPSPTRALLASRGRGMSE